MDLPRSRVRDRAADTDAPAGAKRGISALPPLRRIARSDRVAYAMRALGDFDLPAEFTLTGRTYHWVRTVKHDFFAATGFYRDDAGRMVVLKLCRVADFAGLPLEWLGRWLCARELHFYGRLADVPNIPAVLGRVGRTGFVHEYVPGRPLPWEPREADLIPPGFFAQLRGLMDEVHGRDIAYVDTNKPENILIGDDGRPHLIDFQISWDLKRLWNTPLNRWWLRHLQRGDWYHFCKHKRRLRPQELSDDELRGSERQGWMIRTHRRLFRPYFALRRHTFRRLRETGRLLPEGSK